MIDVNGSFKNSVFVATKDDGFVDEAFEDEMVSWTGAVGFFEASSSSYSSFIRSCIFIIKVFAYFLILRREYYQRIIFEIILWYLIMISEHDIISW